MTQPIDDLAAQMVLEIIASADNGQDPVAIARRYMEKMYERAAVKALAVAKEEARGSLGDYGKGIRWAGDRIADAIRAERAGKDGR